jgi:outer membrane lipoprotein LolB
VSSIPFAVGRGKAAAIAGRLAGPLLLALVVALMAGCATPARRGGSVELQAQQQREDRSREIPDWGLVGRIAVFDGDRNGSGRIEWRQAGDRFEIMLAAPVSRQSWRLTGGPEGAVLEGLDDGPRRARSAEHLLEAEAGWSLPLDLLRAWARGMRGAPSAGLSFDAQALPATLEERGWTVQYRDWHARMQPPMPRRVFASSGERRVRLVVERWLSGAETAFDGAHAAGTTPGGSD